jgi:hypothetical protein
LEQVIEGATANNLAKVIREVVASKGMLRKDEILIKLKLFGVGMYMLFELNFFFLLKKLSF